MGTVSPINKPREAPRSVAGRVPPHDLRAERVVVHAAMQELERAQRLRGIIEPRHFYDRDLGVVYELALELAAEGQPAEPVLITDRLRRAGRRRIDGTSTWFELAEDLAAASGLAAYSEFTSSDYRMFADIVVRTWRAREALTVLHRSAAESYEATDTDAVIDRAIDELTAVSKSVVRADSSTLVEDALFDVWTEMMRNGDEVQRGLSWGYPSCDNAFGRLVGGRMTVLAARAGCGKTSFAWHVAERATLLPADKLNLREAVFFVSAEMNTKTLVRRQVAIRARVSAERIEEGHCTDDDYAALTKAQNEMGYLTIVVDDFDGRAPTPAEIQERVRDAAARLAAGTYRARRSGRLYPRARLRLVVVDYLQRLRSPLGDRPGVTRERQVAAISTGLADMSKALDVHVLALAQAGLHSEDPTKDLTMRDLRESGQIEADADTIVFMTRPERARVKLRHGKARHRSLAEEPVMLHAARGTFWENP